MTDKSPANFSTEIYAIDELNGDANYDFPLSMKLLKEEQIKDEKIQEALQKHASNDSTESSTGTTSTSATPDPQEPSTQSCRIFTGKACAAKSKNTFEHATNANATK
eukprot:CCRYP_002815-RA/>CCRYP_002815-RA protein AED:1.00 eAED:1.00 QI:0/0/0/0/0/0/2/0/106